MKKTFLFSIFALMSLSTVGVYAQKKGKAVKATKIVPAIPVLVNEADSLSYIYGIALTQGLLQHLGQMGIVGDTVAIRTEYKHRMQLETDPNAKTNLEKECQLKVDSTLHANSAALNSFAEGFNEVAYSQGKDAHYTGAAIASQVMKNTDQFAVELLGDKDAFNKHAFANAFISSLLDKDLLLSVANPQEVLQKQSEVIKERQDKEDESTLKAQYKDVIDAGEKFMTENKTKEGVVTLDSGLQYKILTKGDGAIPTANDIVKVHYKGSLVDGTEFDSSYKRGEPTSFSAGHVIKGWTEALTLMPVGSIWELYIPYHLAYGTRDQGTIKPFSNLIFEVELLEVVDAKQLEESMKIQGE